MVPKGSIDHGRSKHIFQQLIGLKILHYVLHNLLN
jgi:hypothetical protein